MIDNTDSPTLKDVRARFEAEGIAVSAWAKQRGFAPHLVYAILSGRTRGRRGEAHKIAVALGLKAPQQRLEISSHSIHQEQSMD